MHTAPWCIVTWRTVSWRLAASRTVALRTTAYRSVAYCTVAYRIVAYCTVAYHIVDSSDWDSGPSGCSIERIEIRQNLGSDFLRHFVDSSFWRLVARTDKKKRNLTNAQTQKAIRQARSASPFRGFFDFGFWSLELQQRKEQYCQKFDLSTVELLLFDRQRNLRWGLLSKPISILIRV
jgi:hypothetical protein